jgi:plastocyanin
MKKIYLVLFICIAFFGAKATTYTITTTVSNQYSPSSLTITVGDQVVISASSFHPANQVDASNWAAGITTPMAGGWGSQTTTFTYSAATTGTVYFMCQNHGPSGMKGMIVVNANIGVHENAATFLNNYNLFPNPATTNVKVSFGLNETSLVSIKLFNVAGQEVKTFVSDLNLASGNYEYNFDLPSGISTGNYFVEISSGTRVTSRKLLITK